MQGFPDIGQITKVLSDESRIQIITILMDKRYHTVHELAKLVHIKDHTASYHLKKMAELGWLTFHKQGRHVYYCLSNDEIAELMEKLMHLSPLKPITSYNKSTEYKQLKAGRSCYCHLAGELGVQFFDQLCLMQFLILENDQLFLTHSGEKFFSDLAINIPDLKKKPGIFAKPCLDWTERKFHLAGNLGTAFFNECIAHEWIIKHPQNRSIVLSKHGSKWFHSFIALENKILLE
ncbi:ArsR/SmtB family transcription factor [Enterococcus crotali]|uniref:ArsR/SmtB family transcription factor n=1 Tax=Enterococcus crotali TaxID=1453587 RepID=UPI000472C233|nr:metalloregulator ArsR/SmtB family transcription factor [Enterococcus crotali]